MKLTNLNVAKIQLEAAIELHIDKAAYIPAITLAGAAEEILGKALPSGQEPAMKQVSSAIIAKYKLNITERELNDQYLNKTKNQLKHISGNGAEVDIEPETESLGMLARAVVNYITLNLPVSPIISRGLVLLEKAYQQSV